MDPAKQTAQAQIVQIAPNRLGCDGKNLCQLLDAYTPIPPRCRENILLP
jgi:hypothetical protein